jgi:hypothetical protein
MLDKIRPIILILIILLQSCSSIPFLDFSHKGAKTKCLYLNTDNLTIKCNCTDKEIKAITIYKVKNSNESFGNNPYDSIFNPALRSIVLPISKDTADKYFLQIELYLTNSHHREAYYIQTNPGDFSKAKKIYSRYFSH